MKFSLKVSRNIPHTRSVLQKQCFILSPLFAKEDLLILNRSLKLGINAVAAPILDKGKVPVAAIAVAGPAYRLPVDKMLEIGPYIASVAKEISREYEFSHRQK